MGRHKGDPFVATQSAKSGTRFASSEVERVGKKLFAFKLPEELEGRFVRDDGKANSLLVRRVLLRALEEHPEWVDELR